MISWGITDKDAATILQIVERAFTAFGDHYPDDRRTLMMDLQTCHVNGCPLWLSGLLAAPMQDFSHDIYGIRKAINRETGELTEDCFRPRYAMVYHAAHIGTPRQHALEPLPEGEGTDMNWCSLCKGWYAARR